MSKRSTCQLSTAISRKVVGKSARDNPERHCGWFLVHCFSKKFQTMARQAMDICLRVLKESNKSRFDSYSVRNSVLIISHITFWDCRVHSFSNNLSRNSCIRNRGRKARVLDFCYLPSSHSRKIFRRILFKSNSWLWGTINFLFSSTFLGGVTKHSNAVTSNE